MTILFKCNRCGKIFTPQRRFCKIEIRERREVMLPVQKKQLMMAQQEVLKEYHLCPDCISDFREFIEKKEKEKEETEKE